MAELNETELNEAVGGGSYKDHEDYYCKPGDTLNLVAGQYGTNAAYLINLNNLTNPNLKPNQHLLVPKKKKNKSF